MLNCVTTVSLYTLQDCNVNRCLLLNSLVRPLSHPLLISHQSYFCKSSVFPQASLPLMSFKMSHPSSAVTEQVHFMMFTLFSNLKDNTVSFNFKAPAFISFWPHLFVGLVFYVSQNFRLYFYIMRIDVSLIEDKGADPKQPCINLLNTANISTFSLKDIHRDYRLSL